MDSKGLKDIIIGCLWGCLAAALFVLGQYVMPLTFLTALCAPALLAAITFKRGLKSLAAALSGLALLAGLIMGMEFALPLLLLVGIPAAGAYFIVRKAPPFEALVGCCACALLGLLAMIGSMSLLSGENILAAVYQQVPDLYAQTMRLLGEQMGMDAQTIKTLVSEARITISNALPGAMMIYAMVGGLIALLVPVRYAQKHQIPVTKLRPFIYWKLPRSFVYGMLLILLVGQLGVWLGWRGFEAVAVTGRALFTLPYSLMGISVICFFMRLRPNVILVAVMALAVVFMAGTPLMFMGIMDSIFNWRGKILEAAGGQMPPKNAKTRKEDFYQPDSRNPFLKDLYQAPRDKSEEESQLKEADKDSEEKNEEESRQNAQDK